MNNELFMTEAFEFNGEFDGEFSGQEWEDESSRRRRTPQRSARQRARARVRRRPRPWLRRAQGASEYVRWVQSALNQIMDLRLPLDGLMGPATRSALRSFQKREGLPVDGIVGPGTRRALIAARSGRVPAEDTGLPSEPEPADTSTSQPAEPEPPVDSASEPSEPEPPETEYVQFGLEPFAFNGESVAEETGEWGADEREDEFNRRRQMSKRGRSGRPRAGAKRRARPQIVRNQPPSEYVRWVQSALNRSMGLRLPLNGVMGPAVRSAIRSFQKQEGLPADGIIGPDTEQALLAASGGQASTNRTSQPSKPKSPEMEIGEQAWKSWEAEVGSNGNGVRAYAPRASTSAYELRNNIALTAAQEWQRWGKGAIKECDAGIRSVLEDYWRTGVGSVPNVSSYCSSVPWSAAFISWVMRKAGASSAFKYSGRHTDYVGAAKQNRVSNSSNPFKAYHISEVSPRVGDLVCLQRNSSGVSYDNVDQGPRDSHCDIVVAVESGQIETIGGNLSDSVKRQTVATNGSGRVIAPGYYAILRVGD